MTDVSPQSDAQVPAAPPLGRFDGREQFQEWIRQALRAAAEEGWREIMFCDPDFRDWPLGERAVLDSLNAWARGGRGRHCTILAANFEALRVRHARFAEWRTRWSHLIDCRQIRGGQSNVVPSVIWSAKWIFQATDMERFRGVASTDAERALICRENLRELINTRSTPGFPSSILGL